MIVRAYSTRGKSREEAAAHIGVGPTKFDQMVSDGRMPEPRTIDGRVVWDVYELDEFFDRLPRRGEKLIKRAAPPPADVDPWSVMAA